MLGRSLGWAHFSGKSLDIKLMHVQAGASGNVSDLFDRVKEESLVVADVVEESAQKGTNHDETPRCSTQSTLLVTPSTGPQCSPNDVTMLASTSPKSQYGTPDSPRAVGLHSPSTISPANLARLLESDAGSAELHAAYSHRACQRRFNRSGTRVPDAESTVDSNAADVNEDAKLANANEGMNEDALHESGTAAASNHAGSSAARMVCTQQRNNEVQLKAEHMDRDSQTSLRHEFSDGAAGGARPVGTDTLGRTRDDYRVLTLKAEDPDVNALAEHMDSDPKASLRHDLSDGTTAGRPLRSETITDTIRWPAAGRIDGEWCDALLSAMRQAGR